MRNAERGFGMPFLPSPLSLPPSSLPPFLPPSHNGTVTAPTASTSKSLPLIPRIVASESSFHRASGAPLRKNALPLSARYIPYFLSAVRITRASAGYPLMSTPALSRTRIPIGGSEATLPSPAECRAGGMCAERVLGQVKRSAWSITPSPATSS
jgi:hypothetical protein